MSRDYYVKTLQTYDKDNDGSLDRKEFKKAIQQIFKIKDKFLIWSLFNAADRDFEGTIDTEEFVQVCTKLRDYGCGDFQSIVKTIFQLVDIDGNGVIDREEFTLFFGKIFATVIENMAEKGEIEEDEIDSDIDSEELEDELLDTYNKLFNEADLNGDGSLDLFEFVRMFNNLSDE